MIEGIFTALYEAMTGAAWLAVLASVGWGVLSILLSPCHLSSIPLIVGFISSQGKMTVGRTFNISLVFSLGILITIALIGVITASLGRPWIVRKLFCCRHLFYCWIISCRYYKTRLEQLSTEKNKN